MITETLGQRLQNIRTDHDKSQKEIAEILQIPTSAYSKYERGINMMGVDKYIKLAKYYNVSLDYFLCIINKPQSIKTNNNKVDKAMLFDKYDKADSKIQKAVNILLELENTYGKL